MSSAMSSSAMSSSTLRLKTLACENRWIRWTTASEIGVPLCRSLIVPWSQGCLSACCAVGRFEGSLSSSEATKSLASGEMFCQRDSLMLSGSIRMLFHTSLSTGSYGLRLSLNGNFPVSSWYAMIPAAHTSDDLDTYGWIREWESESVDGSDAVGANGHPRSADSNTYLARQRLRSHEPRRSLQTCRAVSASVGVSVGVGVSASITKRCMPCCTNK